MVEPGLQPGRVVAAACGRNRAHRGGLLDHARVTHEDGTTAVAAQDVLAQDDPALPGQDDSRSKALIRLARVAHDLVAAELDSRRQERRAVLGVEIEEDAGPLVVPNGVPDDMGVEHRLAAVRGPDADPAPVRVRDGVALDAQSDRAVRGDAVPLRARECAVGNADARAHPARTDHAGTDEDVRERRTVDGQLAECHLMPPDEDAVHSRRLRNRDVQAADADARRHGRPDVRMAQVEDGVGEMRPLRVRIEPRRAVAERDDARAVRRDRRVVPRKPQATCPVAGPVRELGQEDGTAGVELGLQQIGVVAHGRARRRSEPE